MSYREAGSSARQPRKTNATSATIPPHTRRSSQSATLRPPRIERNHRHAIKLVDIKLVAQHSPDRRHRALQRIRLFGLQATCSHRATSPDRCPARRSRTKTSASAPAIRARRSTAISTRRRAALEECPEPRPRRRSNARPAPSRRMQESPAASSSPSDSHAHAHARAIGPKKT